MTQIAIGSVAQLTTGTGLGARSLSTRRECFALLANELSDRVEQVGSHSWHHLWIRPVRPALVCELGLARAHVGS
jgi:hypothetical protein